MATSSTFWQWFYGFRTARPAQPVQPARAIRAVPKATSNTASVRPLAGVHRGMLVQATGSLDRESYLQFIAQAQTCYEHGARMLVVDLREVTRIGLSGHFALHSIARLYAGIDLLDPEGGMSELHRALQTMPAQFGQHIKLIASDEIRRSLRATDLCRCLDVFDDLEQAAAALAQ